MKYKKKIKVIIIIFSFLSCVLFSNSFFLCCKSFANQNDNSQNKKNEKITLDKYYEASCANYTGTWKGSIIDTAGLFFDGGPWTVTVSLYNQNNKIIGKTAAIPEVFESKNLWMKCDNGVLSNIFWVKKKGDCGAVSDKGFLVSKNFLVLKLHFENAMTGTEFLAFLSRENNNYNYPIPKNPADFNAGKIETCH